MSPPPVRFGVQWAPVIPGEDLKEFCRELEGLGYYSIGFPDHFFVGTEPWRAVFEPVSAMGYAAACTERLRLVSIVAAVGFRHPALFARSIANLDVLSGGRIEAGIGTGWFEPEYGALDIPFEGPGIRVARLEEAIGVIKQFWMGGVEFEGAYYRVRGLPGIPESVQKPHPPLLIGAGGPRMLRLAGRHADVVGITTSLRDPANRDAMFAEMRTERVRTKIGIVREAASTAGRSPDEVVIQTQINSIDFDGDDPGHLWSLTGDPERMIDVIEERRQLGISYFMFRERRREMLREFGEKVLPKL